jgi:hypothetical protein
MKNTVLSLGLSVALALSAVTVPTGAMAQSPGDVARMSCENAVVNKIRRMDGSAGRISFSGPKLKQVSNAETGVKGRGSYSNRSFSYQCIYNIRDGRTSNVSVRTKGGDDNPSAGEVAGAIIGTAIAGAILKSMDKHGHANTQSADDGWWSPGGNVSCNSYQSICQEQGRYSPKWTHKIYGG